MLSKQEADEKRGRWAEEVLDPFAQQRPSDAARLTREWNQIALAEQELEESRQRGQESRIAVIKLTLALRDRTIGEYYRVWILRKTPPVVRPGLERDYRDHFRIYTLPKFECCRHT